MEVTQPLACRAETEVTPRGGAAWGSAKASVALRTSFLCLRKEVTWSWFPFASLGGCRGRKERCWLNLAPWGCAEHGLGGGSEAQTLHMTVPADPMHKSGHRNHETDSHVDVRCSALKRGVELLCN